MIGRKPTLLFFETHDDPATTRIIAKLLPMLKKLGYDTFLDELPAYTRGTEDLEAFRKANYEQLITSLAEIMQGINEEKNLNLTESECKTDDYFDRNEFKKGNYIPTDKFASVINKMPEFTFRGMGIHSILEIGAAFEVLYTQLSENNITYQGIDDARTEEYRYVEDARVFAPINQVREMTMASAYCLAEKPVIGRNGLAHVSGIQSILLSEIEKEICLEFFSFFYVFSKPVHAGSLGEFEAKARANGLNLPLGLLALDGSKLSDDEIISAILNEIQKKNKYADEARDNFTFFRGQSRSPDVGFREDYSPEARNATNDSLGVNAEEGEPLAKQRRTML